MKEYITIKIDNNILIFNFRAINQNEKKFVNNNSFVEGSIYYTLKHFKNNRVDIANMIKEKYPTINIIRVERLITFKYLVELINTLNIIELILNFSSTIDVEDYKLFLNCNSLRKIDCYFMSSDFVYAFKEKNIEVNITSINPISQKFMQIQESDSKDYLYYRKIINIKEDYPELIDDLKEFLRINYKLKAIHIYVYSKELINSIVDLVKNDESRNVVVFLHQSADKGDFITTNFDWLKKLSEKCREEYTCEFRILYANSFIKNNLFKQLTFNNMKLMFILCIYVCIVSLVLIKSYEYIEKMSIASLNNELVDNNDEIEEELPNEDEEDSENLTEEEIKKKYTFDKSFKKLKKINKDTVAYIFINNTQISYPVVQHSDNSYYLKRDFYKNKTSMGWIYLDYRNDINEINDNNIIYGHSMLNGTMFGTLKKVLDSSWRKEDDNMIISFTTENGSYKFKIFSAYKVDYTTDYLITNFESKKKKTTFLNMIKKRSSFKSNVVLNTDDKILTLSTCTGSNNKRLVVHAVLIKEEE